MNISATDGFRGISFILLGVWPNGWSITFLISIIKAMCIKGYGICGTTMVPHQSSH